MTARGAAVVRDVRWLALVVAAALFKLRFGLWLMHNCESAAPWHYLCADLGPWDEFLNRARSGIPYVDFGREYPVGIGALYWGLGWLFDVQGLAATTRLQVGLSWVGDVACAALLYVAARPKGSAWATLAAVAWLLLPAAFVLSPVRYESVVGVAMLLGYLAHVRGRYLWAAAIWSVGISLKWYPVIAIAIQELAVLDREYFRARLWRVLALCAAVQLVINGPFLLGGLLAHGHIDNWLSTYTFHAERRLGADTVLGVVAMWIGPIKNGFAAWSSAALAALVLVTRRTMAFEAKFVAVCAALLVLNRVYSPQFNLWFYPFLLLALVGQGGARSVALGLLLVVIDLTTVAIFPFLYAAVVTELQGALPWGGMAAYGKVFSEYFTAAVFMRAFALLALMTGLYAAFPREG